jgi:hypothetical protein
MFNFIKNLLQSYKIKKQIQNSVYVDTLYSVDWLISHHDRIMTYLPETWTHIDNIDYVKFGFQLNLLGVPWETKDHLIEIIHYLERLKMVNIKNEFQVVRNLDNVFNQISQN